MAPLLVPDRTETLAPRSSSSERPRDAEAAAYATPVGQQPVGQHTAGQHGEYAGKAAPSGRDRCASLGDGEGDPATPVGSDDPDRYEQVVEHARGGLGRVVRAVDRRLGRTVAVKELLRHDPSNEARFMREALITARLEHPGIVPVHEAGRWPNGDPYYVMKLVEGRTLKELIGEGHTLRERLGLLPHAIAIADAVGYAHSQGVIHRDLKPSNVIVGSFGETVVVDWGLARDRRRDVPEPADDVLLVSGAGVSTVSGKVIGTPAYMSPEQARGDLVDERADVYAIGAVLYEVLAGTPPHSDETPQATLERVIAGPPLPLGAVVPHLPGELATIVAKAMARDPDQRYPNAIALAEDLRRFATGKLVSAHSYTAWSLLRKKLSNHRGVVAVGLASAIALGAVGVESFRRVVAERNIARGERTRAEDALSSAEKRKHELVLLQAETALPKDPTAALAWLKAYDMRDEDRGKVVDVIDEAMSLGVARHVFRPGDWVFDAQFTPDGSTLIAAVRDRTVRAYDLRTGVEVNLGEAPSAPEALALSADGHFAATGGTLGEAIVWPLTGGPPRRLLDGNGRTVTSVQFSTDGARLLVQRESSPPEVIALEDGSSSALGPRSALKFSVASADWTRVVMLTAANEIAAVSGDRVRSLVHTDKAINFLSISPRGDIVLVQHGGLLSLVPFAGGKLTPLAAYDDRLKAVAWSEDGKLLALGGYKPDILVATIATGELRELRGHTDALYTLEFSHDGKRLLSASDDGTARVWTLADRTAIVLRGHDDDVYRARFSADETSVATSSLDGSARVWALDHPGSAIFVEGGAIESITSRADGLLVRTTTSVARWDISTGERESLFSWANEPHGLGVGIPSPDGEQLAIPSADGSIEVRRHTGTPIVLRGHQGVISHIEFTSDGSHLISSSFDGTLRRWDLATGKDHVLLDGAVPVRGFAVAHDGRVAVQAGDAAYLVAPDDTVTKLGRGNKWCVAGAEFEAVRDRLVMQRCDHSLAVFDGTHLIDLPNAGYQARRITASPDGKRIAGAMNDRTIRLWDAETGRVLDVLRGHSDLVLDVAFSPDGTQLASAAYDKTIRIWDLANRRHRVLRGHAAPVNCVAWLGGTRLVTGSPDGTLRVWDAPALALPTASDLRSRLDAATTARIDLDRPATGATRGT